MKTLFNTTILLHVAVLVAGVTSQATDESNNTSNVPGLQARSYVGEMFCGVFANADADDANELVEILGSDKKDHKYPIKALGCYRVACRNTSGVYVCNDDDFTVTVTGHDVASAANYINQHCCYATELDHRHNPVRSGQQFTQWGWNVVIGYANCDAGPTQRPSDAGGWGVNSGFCGTDKTVTTVSV